MNIRFLAVFSIICGIGAACLRIYDFVNFYDGMFLDKGNLALFSVLLCILPALVCIISMLKTLDTGINLVSHKGMPQGVFSIMSGITALIIGGLNLSELLSSNHYSSTLLSNQYVLPNGFSAEIPYAVSTLVLGLYFCVVGIVHIMDKENLFTKIKLITLIPVLHSVIAILYVYVHFSNSLILSENIFILFGAIFIAPTYMNIAKFLTGQDEKVKSFKTAFMFSLLSLAFNIAYFISEITLPYLGYSAYDYYPQFSQILVFIVSINSMVFLSLVQTKNIEIHKKSNKVVKRYR